MIYEHTEWKISKLLNLVKEGHLNLSPEYQRNPVWRSSAQMKLIDTIVRKQPIPSFFVRKTSSEDYEMVDGQQRARTIIGYWENLIPGLNGHYIEQELKLQQDPKAFRQQFLDYEFPVTEITSLEGSEKIEDFYVLLNVSSLRLNRPELRKAEYYNTRFLQVVRSAIDIPQFRALELFSEASLQRMTDFESVSEVLAAFKFGIYDKKEKVDQIFEDDITEAEQSSLFEDFSTLVECFSDFDQIQRLRRTRIRQKADFFTVCNFFHSQRAIPKETREAMFRAFVKFAPHIRPSNEKCEPLREYAHNCVTQSNSKAARAARHAILYDLLANPAPVPNKRQRQLLDFFRVPEDSVIRRDGLLIVNSAALEDPTQKEFKFESLLEDGF